MSCCAKVLSEQEKWIKNSSMYCDARRERTFRALKKLKSTPITMDISRAKYFTESFKETEGKPLSLRWAYAMKNIAEKIDVYIDDDDLIVGKASGKPGRRGLLFPELEGPALMEIRGSEKRDASPYEVAPEDLEYIENVLSDCR